MLHRTLHRTLVGCWRQVCSHQLGHSAPVASCHHLSSSAARPWSSGEPGGPPPATTAAPSRPFMLRSPIHQPVISSRQAFSPLHFSMRSRRGLHKASGSLGELQKPLLEQQSSKERVPGSQEEDAPSMLTAKAYYFLSSSAGVFLYPYITLFLNDMGVTLEEIGMLGALRPWLGVAATVAGPLLADHWNCHRTILLSCFILSATFRTSMWFSSDVTLVCAALLLADLLLGPVGPMVDSLVLSRCTSDADYGKQRLFGSVGWGLLAPVAGILIGVHGLGAGFLAYAALSIPAVIAIHKLASQPSPTSYHPAAAHEHMSDVAGSSAGGGGSSGAGGGSSGGGGGSSGGGEERGRSSAGGSVVVMSSHPVEMQDMELRQRHRGSRTTWGSDQQQQDEVRSSASLGNSPHKATDAGRDDDVACSSGARGFRVGSDVAVEGVRWESEVSSMGQELRSPAGSPARVSPRAETDTETLNDIGATAGSSSGGGVEPVLQLTAVTQTHAAAGTVVDTDVILLAAQDLLHLPTTPHITTSHPATDADKPPPHVDVNSAGPAGDASTSAALRKLFHQPEVWQLLLKCLAGGLGAGLVGNYNFLFARDLGADATVMGLMLTSNCAAETPVFALQGRIMAHMTPETMLHVSLAAMVVRLLLYGTLHVTNPHPLTILPIELLQGLTLGLGWSAICVLSKRLAPPGLQTSLQGVATAVFAGLGGGLGALLGGMMLDWGWTWTHLWSTSALVVAVLWTSALALPRLPPPNKTMTA